MPKYRKLSECIWPVCYSLCKRCLEIFIYDLPLTSANQCPNPECFADLLTYSKEIDIIDELKRILRMGDTYYAYGHSHVTEEEFNEKRDYWLNKKDPGTEASGPGPD